MTDNRKYIRINKSSEVSYKILRKFMKSGTRSSNISIGGICLPTVQRLNPGTFLELEISFVEIESIVKAVGEIIWINEKKQGESPFEIGIKFIDISLSDVELINKMILNFKEN